MHRSRASSWLGIDKHSLPGYLEGYEVRAARYHRLLTLAFQASVTGGAALHLAGANGLAGFT